MSPSALGRIELGNALDTLRIPLTDREVLIPLGKQGFIPGKLRPTVSKVGDDQCEIVRLKLSEETITTRDEARKILHTELTKGRTRPKSSSKVSKDQNTKDTSSVAPGAGPQFYEIREEYNGETTTKGELINISSQLENLQKQGSGDVGLGEVRAEQIVDSSPTKLQPVSDEAYSNISSRLEELMLLEQQAEGNAKVNLASSRKVQGNGWSKGFLNKKPKPKKSSPSKKAEIEIPKQPDSSDPSRKVTFEQGTKTPKGASRISENVLSDVVQERQRSQDTATSTQRAPPRTSRFAKERGARR